MEKFAQAVQLHQLGRCFEAERLYREVVAEQSDNAQAWYLLSALLMERGEDAAACGGLQHAVRLAPDNPAILSNLGLLYSRQGRNEEAATTLLRAVSLKPDLVEASYNLGLVLLALRQTYAALECFQQVADLKPDLAVNQLQLARILVSCQESRRALGHIAAALASDPSSSAAKQELANVMSLLGRHLAAVPAAQKGDLPNDALAFVPEQFPSAVARFQQAAQLRSSGQLEAALALLMALAETWPQWFEAVIELGLILVATGDLDAAQLCFEQAVDLRVNSEAAHRHLADTLIARNEITIAIGHLQCAVVLSPDSVESMRSLARLYLMNKRHDAAEAMIGRAIKLQSNDAALRSDLALVLSEKGEVDRALACYDVACRLDPTLQDVWLGRANLHFDIGRIGEAIADHRQGLTLGPNATMHGSLIYHMMFDPTVSNSELVKEGRRWYSKYAAGLAMNPISYPNTRDPERRLRIGFVSPDFRDHCQSFFTIPLFSHLDRSAFELYAYSTARVPDRVSERLKALVDEWRDVATLNDDLLTRTIRADAPDILVDLTMHMQNGRPLVFARKPAPVQISWLAYPGTTGLETVDYRLSDPLLDPLELGDGGTVERCMRLPDCFWCYDPLGETPDVGPLPALVAKQVTFGCLNNFAKTNRVTYGLWAGVLRAIPQSRLLLLAPPGSARERTRREFAHFGIQPNRIEFVSRRPRREYLATYATIDVCLDTAPYNGHTTSFDAAWMGVPVITIVGATSVGRAGLCLAHHLGAPELVAHDASEFAERAVSLCDDLQHLAEMRAGLRDRLRRTPLMDAPRFARSFESALRGIWRDYCSV